MASTSMGGHSERLTREITVYLRFAVCFHCLRLSLEAEHFRRVGGGGGGGGIGGGGFVSSLKN